MPYIIDLTLLLATLKVIKIGVLIYSIFFFQELYGLKNCFYMHTYFNIKKKNKKKTNTE